MNASSPQKLPFGLLELDAAGAVIRYSPASDQRSEVRARDILGRHFFTEVVPDERVKGFQARFHLFMEHGQTLDRFDTSFASAEGQIKVQVLLARIKEKSEQGGGRIALVRIMPEQEQAPRLKQTGEETRLWY
jgi:photoactive yellow protein